MDQINQERSNHRVIQSRDAAKRQYRAKTYNQLKNTFSRGKASESDNGRQNSVSVTADAQNSSSKIKTNFEPLIEHYKNKP